MEVERGPKHINHEEMMRLKKRRLIIFLIIGAVFLGLAGTATVFALTDTNPLTTEKTTATSETADPETSGDDDNLTNVTVTLSPDQANQIALAQYPDATLVNTTLEDENGTIVYAVVVQDANGTYDVKVDANSGTVLKVETDGDDASDTDTDQTEHASESESDAETE